MKTVKKEIVSRGKKYIHAGTSATRREAIANAKALSGKTLVRKIGDGYGWAWEFYTHAK